MQKVLIFAFFLTFCQNVLSDNKQNSQQLDEILKRLETLESENKDLKKENLNLKEMINKDVEQRLAHVEEVSKLKVVRTCEEMARHGVQASGRYLIDPDGDLLGNDPIEVICDFESNTTEIPHDSEDLIKIEKCETPGCSRYNIGYYASMPQIQALIQLSDRCEQEINFGCFLAPLQDEGVNYGWWEDKNQEANYFFAGDNVGQHTCGCGKFTSKNIFLSELNFDFIAKARLKLVLTPIYYAIVTPKIQLGIPTKVRLQPRKFFQ